MSSRSGTARFRPRARILKILGEELITDEVIALVELVKNSYDADATKVDVILKNVTDIENGSVIIHDNGSGMSLETVLNSWLEPGTEYRKSQRDKGERSKKYNRQILGEKGVGRFAAQKLGNLITLITRSKDEEKEILVEIDWQLFDKNEYLSEVKVNWMTIEPKIFKNDKTGTRIEINFIKKSWTKSMIMNLAQKLEGLRSPFKEKILEENSNLTAPFNINLICSDYQKLIDEIRPLNEILEESVYSFKGNVSEKGILTAEYRFYNPAFESLKQEKTISKDIRDSVDSKGAICGPFEFKYYVWDLDPKTLKETVTRKIYDDYIKPHTGIRIYRDKFRIWPYGEEGNDWLEMNKRRVNNPKKCFSNNQIIGLVEISAVNNPYLVDKTDREGLILNEYYENFRKFVLNSINEFEILRRIDKNIVDEMREVKIKMDDTLMEIERLKEKMKGDEIYNKYKSYLNNIQRAYNNEITNTLEPLIVSAGIGIAYQMPAHEISIQIEAIQDMISEFKIDLEYLDISGKVTNRIPILYELTENIDDIAKGALELSRRKPKEFNLKSIVDFSLYIKKPELIRDHIDFTLDVIDEIRINGYQNLLMTCILNIIDNSIYWLNKNVKDKKIVTTIRFYNHKPQIIISDNGPGIDRVHLPYLGEAYYTTKPDGTGLGLFITKRAMQRNSGEVKFGFYPNDPCFLEGANVILEFNSDVVIKG
ncbi:MAG: ATP-binding protein [Candidatus Helarchaeota archaeon]